MKEKFKALIDPEIYKGMEQIPPIIANGEIGETNYLEVRELSLSVSEIPFEHPHVNLEERTISFNNRTLKVYIYTPKKKPKTLMPAMVWIHGGGYIVGSAREDDKAISFVENLDCTVISIEYQLSPEAQHPEPMLDCHAGLLWTFENAESLGINPDKIAIGGESAGGGMAARTVLYNQAQNGPKLAFQFLRCPMLDNTHDTPSGRDSGYFIWDRDTSFFGWECYLGNNPGKDADKFQSPSRATNLSGLPPTYINVGAVELFRDECIAYAQQLMKDGVPTQLQVFPGVVHGADVFITDAEICQQIQQNQITILKKAFNHN